MTQTFFPDIQFLLRPPADPELRPTFESSQDDSGRAGTRERRGLELELQLAVRLAEREGESCGWEDLLDAFETYPVLGPEPVTSGRRQ
jgi:hypothetical protein